MATEQVIKDLRPGQKNINMIFIILDIGEFGRTEKKENKGRKRFGTLPPIPRFNGKFRLKFWLISEAQVS